MTPAVDPSPLICRLCGQGHRLIALAPGERAHCRRCDGVLAQRARCGAHARPAFAVAGLVLAVPAVLLPFISARAYGNERISHLFTGVGSLWANHMPLLAIWVLLCGGLVPIALLAALAALLAWERRSEGRSAPAWLDRATWALAHWAIPEVQVLAVLVGLIRLGSLVEVTIGPGFWCYAGMTVCLLLAVRAFELTPEGASQARRERVAS